MEEIFEGKKAIAIGYEGVHYYSIGEVIKLLSIEEKKPSDLDEIIVWYTFTNEKGLHQTLVESEFEWIKKK